MSLLELFREFEAARLVRVDQHNRDVSLAWYGEALHRSKRLPGLQTLIVTDGKRRQQTPGQLRGMLEMLSASFGGHLVKGKHARTRRNDAEGTRQ